MKSEKLKINSKLVKFLTVVAVLGLAVVLVYYLPAVFRGKTDIPSGIYLGHFYLRFYGPILAAGVLAAGFVTIRFAPKFGFSKAEVEGAVPWAVIAGLLGARIYFVVFSWEYYDNHLLEIFQIWHGGLAIYGAILGGFLGLLLYARINDLLFPRLLDLLIIGLPLGQSIGRWGNFFNEEAFGGPTELPWKMFVSAVNRPLAHLEFQFFHPTFLYESLWNLAVFLVLLYFVKRELSAKTGFFSGLYLMLYGLGRLWIEALRLDSFYLANFRVDQLVSVFAVISGLFLLKRVYAAKTKNLESY